jgi:tRNA (guanine37-N1)-methyltransferase
MRMDFVTLFPEMFAPVMGTSIVGRAVERGLLEWGCVNPREFTEDKHKKVDDRPFGGGAGMVMMAQPLADAIKSVKKRGSRVIFMSPQGKRFDQTDAKRLAALKHVVLVCGHYEGVDERAAKLFDEELSVGDYVLTGGELPALVVADAVTRLLPGVLKKEDAAANESFEGGVLDYPQYTRPRVWKRQAVPDVLFSGDHKKIAEWRRHASLEATRRKRPDLLDTQSKALTRSGE